MFFNLSQNIWTQSRSLQRYFSRENINSTTGLWFRLIGGRSSESIPKKYLSFGINPIVRTRKTRKPGMVECKGLVDTAMHGNDCQALPLNSRIWHTSPLRPHSIVPSSYEPPLPSHHYPNLSSRPTFRPRSNPSAALVQQKPSNLIRSSSRSSFPPDPTAIDSMTNDWPSQMERFHTHTHTHENITTM